MLLKQLLFQKSTKSFQIINFNVKNTAHVSYVITAKEYFTVLIIFDKANWQHCYKKFVKNYICIYKFMTVFVLPILFCYSTGFRFW